uniref:DUF4168 domain-containing protein n=1 Tax=Parastrongyloides trichosuri TaxID=131310 RepID=A0A0N4ZKN1_PARTI
MKSFIKIFTLFDIRKKHFIVICFCLYLSELINGLPVSNEFVSVESLSGDNVNVPKGIFFHSESEMDINTQHKLTDWEAMNPLDIATSIFDTVAEVSSKKKQAGGLYVPMPFGLSPLNIQLSKDSNNNMRLSDNPTTVSPSLEMSKEEKDAFMNARIACLQQDDQACDKALDKMHVIKYGFSKVTELEVKRKTQENLGEYVQQELMEWALPNVEKKLREMRSGNTDEKIPKRSRLPSRFP